MRINFTHRTKIDRKHAVVRIVPDGGGLIYELDFQIDQYPKLPKKALVFLEASQGIALMRFPLGTVGQLESPPVSKRRLSEFAKADRLSFRLKVTAPDGDDAGKLLAEADNLKPKGADDGRISLISISQDDLGQTPWELKFVPSDPDIPELVVNERIGGKTHAGEPVFRAHVMPAVLREVFSQLVLRGREEEEKEHWSNLWYLLATSVLKQPDPPHSKELNEAAIVWIKNACDAFAAERRLAERILSISEEC